MIARLSVVKLHNTLHGGLPQQGMGTAIIEVKLNQQLAWFNQEPFYQIFLDLRKAYDDLDQGRCLKILSAYGVGPNLLATFAEAVLGQSKNGLSQLGQL